MEEREGKALLWQQDLMCFTVMVFPVQATGVRRVTRLLCSICMLTSEETQVAGVAAPTEVCLLILNV